MPKISLNIHHTAFFSLAFCSPAFFSSFFFSFFHPLIHSTKPMYASNLSTHSVTQSCLIAHCAICLAGLAADKAVDYNRSEVTRVLQSLQRDRGIIRAGRWPVIDGAGACCHWQETRFIITFLHHSPSRAFTVTSTARSPVTGRTAQDDGDEERGYIRPDVRMLDVSVEMDNKASHCFLKTLLVC